MPSYPPGEHKGGSTSLYDALSQFFLVLILLGCAPALFDFIYDNDHLGFLSPRGDDEEARGGGNEGGSHERSRSRRQGYSRFEDEDGGDGGGDGAVAGGVEGRGRTAASRAATMCASHRSCRGATKCRCRSRSWQGRSP